MRSGNISASNRGDMPEGKIFATRNANNSATLRSYKLTILYLE